MVESDSLLRCFKSEVPCLQTESVNAGASQAQVSTISGERGYSYET